MKVFPLNPRLALPCMQVTHSTFGEFIYVAALWGCQTCQWLVGVQFFQATPSQQTSQLLESALVRGPPVWSRCEALKDCSHVQLLTGSVKATCITAFSEGNISESRSLYTASMSWTEPASLLRFRKFFATITSSDFKFNMVMQSQCCQTRPEVGLQAWIPLSTSSFTPEKCLWSSQIIRSRQGKKSFLLRSSDSEEPQVSLPEPQVDSTTYSSILFVFLLCAEDDSNTAVWFASHIAFALQQWYHCVSASWCQSLRFCTSLLGQCQCSPSVGICVNLLLQTGEFGKPSANTLRRVYWVLPSIQLLQVCWWWRGTQW